MIICKLAKKPKMYYFTIMIETHCNCSINEDLLHRIHQNIQMEAQEPSLTCIVLTVQTQSKTGLHKDLSISKGAATLGAIDCLSKNQKL